MNDKRTFAVALAAAVILTWRSAVTCGAVIDVFGVRIGKEKRHGENKNDPL